MLAVVGYHAVACDAFILVWDLCSLHNPETVQGFFMKLGTNMKHERKICEETRFITSSKIITSKF